MLVLALSNKLRLLQSLGAEWSHTGINALVGGGDAGGVGVFSGQIGDLTGVSREGQWAVLVGRGVSPAATMGWDGCRTFSHPAYCGTFSSGIGSNVQCSTGASVMLGFRGPPSPSSSGRTTPWKTSSSVKDR